MQPIRPSPGILRHDGEPQPDPARGLIRFYPLALEFADRLERGDLSADAWVVLTYLFLKAKRASDTGVVWICSTILARRIRGLSESRAKRALRELASRRFIKRFRQAGSRSSYPVVLDAYLTFTRRERQALVVSADATSDWRKPHVVVRTRGEPCDVPRAAPPYYEPRSTNHEEGLSPRKKPDPGRPAPGGAGVGPEELADLWNEVLPGLPQPDRPLARDTARTVRAALKREPSLNAWRTRFKRIAHSAFLTGKKADFIAHFLWTLEAKSVAKIDAGEYDDRTDGGPEKRGNGYGIAAQNAAALDQVLRECKAAEQGGPTP